MALIINNEKINDTLIVEEIERLRPSFQKVFHKQDAEKQEETLLEWAKENIVEKTLIEQYAKKYPIKISQKKIEEFVDKLKRKASITFVADEELKRKLKRKKSELQKIYRKELNFILIKPAGPDCNMDCTYCFYLKKKELFDKTTACRMSEDILKEVICQAMSQSGNQVAFGWQGGEPTLMGLPFFQKAVEYQKQFGHGKTVSNGLQTNGLLIDREWAKFLKTYNFLVGLSLDGPGHIHDHYRVKKGKQGTWKQVTKNAKLLLQEHVEVNALSVINNYSVQFPKKIYAFHKELGLNFMQFIPCVETIRNNFEQIAYYSVKPGLFGNFLCTMFDLWLSDFVDGIPTTSVRFFDSVLFSYIDLTPPECTLLKECGVYFVVEHNGDMYPCDFFVEPELKLGNVMKNQMIDMLNCQQQETFGENKCKVPKKCIDCKWLRYCRGGCPKNRFYDNGINFLCKSYQMFFEHADKELHNLAEKWKKNNLSIKKK